MSIYRKLLLSFLLIATFVTQTVSAGAISCSQLFSERSNNAEVRKVLRELPRDGNVNEKDQVKQTGQFTGRVELLRAARSKLSDQDYGTFLEFYFSHFFFDRKLLVEDKLASQSNFLKAPEIYNEKGEFPFDGYLKAREFIFSLKFEDLATETIQSAHRFLLSAGSVKPEHFGQKRFFFWTYKPRNSENTPTEALGQIRSVCIGYSDTKDAPSNSGIKLSDGTVLLSGTRNYKEISEQTPYIGKSSSSYVEYTPLSNWRRFENRLSTELKQSLLDLEAQKTKLDTDSTSTNSIRSKFLSELLSASIAQMRKNLAEAKTKGDIINAAAKFYQEFVSIHPFQNGNGRMGRVLVERLLEEYDLPPPLWTVFGQDVVLKSDEFLWLFQDSIKLSAQFHNDMKTLVNSGVDYRLTPTALLSKDIVSASGVPKKKIIPEEFMTWLNFRYEKKALTPEEAMKRFDEWKSGLNYNGDLDFGIKFATPLFVETFGLSQSKRDFVFKMKTFYSKDVVYRGLSLDRVPTTEELLEHFVKTKGIMTGMGIDENAFEQQSRSAFDTYNQDLANDPKKLEKRIYDHVQEKSGYWDSKLVSFSRDPDVANWFKNGYMMSKDFKLNMKARFEIQIRDRKVGSVDVMKKTKTISEQGIGEEKEVLYVAGIDPEAVARVVVDDIAIDPEKNKMSWRNSVSKRELLNAVTIVRRRFIDRLSFDTFRLTEYNVKERTVRRVQYKLGSDGKFVVESETVKTYNPSQVPAQ